MSDYHDRIPDDNYPTPPYCTRRILEALPDLPGGRWLEPCAGSGSIIRTAREMRPEVSWWACELRLTCTLPLQAISGLTWQIGDYLRTTWPVRFDVVLTNPPYSIALEFVQRALTMADHVVMLLRLGFLASAKRYSFHRAHPSDVYVLPDRPSFAFEGSDSQEYGWFHWWPGATGRVSILNLTPSGAR